MLMVTKAFKFESAHHLPYYEGPCHNLHGHSYKLEVTVTSTKLNQLNCGGSDYGMIIDFKDLKTIVNKVIGEFDHANLNDFFPNPTAELMVRNIANQVNNKLKIYDDTLEVVSAKLWETDTSYATFLNDKWSSKILEV